MNISISLHTKTPNNLFTIFFHTSIKFPTITINRT